MGLRGRGWSCVVVLLLAAGVWCAPSAWAQGAASDGRVLAMFDFEDLDDAGRPIGQSYPMPVSWYAIGWDPLEDDPNFLEQPRHGSLTDRRHFPDYAEVGFSSEHAASGRFSLRLGLDGGNAGAYVRTGVLPAVPESSYIVHSRVRTEGLEHAAAVLCAVYVDAEGARVQGTLRYSEPLRTGGEWAEASVPLDPAPGRAAWIGLSVMLLQPEERRNLGIDDDKEQPNRIVLEDIKGRAWFDDIGVWQLPHLDLTVQHPSHVIRAPERPEVRVHVRDLTGQRLWAQLNVYDERRQRVASVRRSMGDGELDGWRWTPDLPGLGWYVLDLGIYDARSDRTPIARKVSAVLWTPAEAASAGPGTDGYAVLATRLRPERVRLIPEMLDRAGVTAVTLSAWRPDATAESLPFEQDRLAETLESFALAGVKPTLSFGEAPQVLRSEAASEGFDSLADLLPDESAWMRFVVPVLVRQGQQVRSWQVGPAVTRGTGMPLSLGKARTLLDRVESYAPSPTLVLPWSVHHPPPPSADDEQRLRFQANVPTGIQSDQLSKHLETWRALADRTQALLRSYPASEVTQERRIAELALRMLALREAEIGGVAIDAPFSPTQRREASLLPDPLLGAFAGTARRLRDRRVIGRLPMPQGLEAVILADRHGNGGALMMWSASAEPGRRDVEMHLGREPLLMDVWGNAAALPARNGRHRVTLREVPRFVERIDVELARFRAGFTIDRPMIVSEQTKHRRLLTLVNPWPRTITGSLRFTGPEGWDVQPVRHHFSIPAGGRVQLPLAMSFPVHEVAGRKTLSAEVDFVADRRYRVNLWTPLELGLPDLEFDASLALEPAADPDAPPDAPPDAIATCLITNTGDKPRSLYAFANLYNHPRQERVIARLEPGQTIVRRFRFPSARDELLEYPLRAGIRETNGPAILNARIDLASSY